VDGDPNLKKRIVTIDPNYLIGRTFLKETEEDGQRFRARVVHAIIDKDDELKKGLECMKFICEVPNSTIDEIFTYNSTLLKRTTMIWRVTPNNSSGFVALLHIKDPSIHWTRIGKAHHTTC
jgi:hypothetical protein